MREGWRRVALGEVTRQVRDQVPVEEHSEYPLLGVRWYGAGTFVRETVTSATSKAKRLNRVQPGQFIYNRLFAGKGSFGVVPEGQAGCYVSNEFPLFDCDSDQILPEYLALIFQQTSVWSMVEMECVGTTASRSRWKEERFKSFVIDLPPLGEQRQIVSLVTAIKAAEVRCDELTSRYVSLLHAHLNAPPDAESVVLGDLASMSSGPSWRAMDQRESASSTTTAVIGIKTTRPDGTLDLSERSFVDGLPATVQKLTPNSLVLIRTNGNRERIGNPYRTTTDLVGHAVSAFQIIVEPLDTSLRDQIYWQLKSPRIQAAITEAASGSTGLGNIAIRWLKKLELRRWSDGAGLEWVETSEAIQAALDAARRYSSALASARSEIVADLLSGEHEIPESYDALLSEVA